MSIQGVRTLRALAVSPILPRGFDTFRSLARPVSGTIALRALHHQYHGSSLFRFPPLRPEDKERYSSKQCYQFGTLSATRLCSRPRSTPEAPETNRRRPEATTDDTLDGLDPSGQWNSQQPPVSETSLEAATAAELLLEGKDDVINSARVRESLLSIPPPPILGAILFFLMFSGAAYTVAAWYSIRQTLDVAQEVERNRNPFGKFDSFLQNTFGSTADGATGRLTTGNGTTIKRGQLRAALSQRAAERYGWRLQWLTGWCDQLHLPQGVKEFVGWGYVKVVEGYLNLHESQESVLPVVIINSVVFGCFLMVPPLSGVLMRNFTHAPFSLMEALPSLITRGSSSVQASAIHVRNKTYTMLTSTFAHAEPLHFAFNNIALWSIGAAAFLSPAWPLFSHFSLDEKRDQMRNGYGMPDASITPHFLAFFASAGIFASLVSHLFTAVRFRRVVGLSRMRSSSASSPNRHNNSVLLERLAALSKRSLGSSGAIYSILVMSAFAFPDARLSIIFLPFFSFPITYAVGGSVIVDLIGLVRGWTRFDHVAHLG